MSILQILHGIKLKDYQKLLDSMPVAIAIAEAETGLMRFANQKMADLVGWKRKDMLGARQADFHPANDASHNPFMRHVDALKRGEVISLEAEILHKDGRRLPVEITANNIAVNNEALMVGIFIPIEKRIEVMGLLQKQQLEMTAIYDNSQIGIMQVDGQRMITHCNQTMANILGANSPSEVVGVSVEKFHVNHDSYVEFGKRFFFSLTKKKALHVEFQLKRLDGSVFWAVLSGKALD